MPATFEDDTISPLAVEASVEATSFEAVADPPVDSAGSAGVEQAGRQSAAASPTERTKHPMVFRIGKPR